MNFRHLRDRKKKKEIVLLGCLASFDGSAIPSDRSKRENVLLSSCSPPLLFSVIIQRYQCVMCQKKKDGWTCDLFPTDLIRETRVHSILVTSTVHTRHITNVINNSSGK